ncbi:GH10116 [Drosophila grimshawi]|uniref:GH10116 n=1 Tax=Drosophila grimshawi TaxID=7222 RepID=B4JCN3_DROGR|nr:GH10116 [Drosophila grimshawi]
MLNPWYMRPVGYHNYNNNNNNNTSSSSKDTDLLSFVPPTTTTTTTAATTFGVDVGMGLNLGLGLGVGVAGVGVGGGGGVGVAGESPQTCLPYFGMEMEMPSTTTVSAKAHKLLPEFLIPLHEIMFQHHYQQQRQQVVAATTTAGSTMGTLINSLPGLGRETFNSAPIATIATNCYATKSLTPQQQQQQQQQQQHSATRPRHNGEHLFVRHFHERDRLIREHQLQQQLLRDQDEEQQLELELEVELELESEQQQQQQQKQQQQLESTGHHNHHWHGVVYDGNGNAMTAKHNSNNNSNSNSNNNSNTNSNNPQAAAVLTPLVATSVACHKDSHIYEQPNGLLCCVGNPGNTGSPKATTAAAPAAATTATTTNKGLQLTEEDFLWLILRQVEFNKKRPERNWDKDEALPGSGSLERRR